MHKLTRIILGLFISVMAISQANAAEYMVDNKGMHAAIQFKIQHLGYSWLWGRFNDFEGSFEYDSNQPDESSIEMTINTGSIDSNNSERDKHLRSDDFLNASKYPEAKFVSKSVTFNDDGTGIVDGMFTLKDVTKPLQIKISKVGEGKDPWGGYRAGFSGTTSFALKDYNIMKELGPASQEVTLIFSIEGIKK